MRTVTLLLSIALIVSAEAGIGESPLQLANRYGAPKDSQVTRMADKTFPLVEAAIHHTYEYQGWKIRAAFLQVDGAAIRMDYQKMSAAGVSPIIQEYELQAIAGANTPPGMSWRKAMYDNPDSPNKGLAKAAEDFIGDAVGQKMWRRSDGAILWLRSNMIVRLELPAARQYEAQLKATKEQKARASVPKF
jgi:hypothetical protein